MQTPQRVNGRGGRGVPTNPRWQKRNCAQWELVWTEQPLLQEEPSLRVGKYSQRLKTKQNNPKQSKQNSPVSLGTRRRLPPLPPRAAPAPRTRSAAAAASERCPSPARPPQPAVTLHPPEHFVIHGFECAGGFGQGWHGSGGGRAAVAAASAPRPSGARTGAREAQAYGVRGRLTCGRGGPRRPERSPECEGRGRDSGGREHRSSCEGKHTRQRGVTRLFL